jgi:hypothetical protein
MILDLILLEEQVEALLYQKHSLPERIKILMILKVGQQV